MRGHTPGPWTVEGRAILAGEARKRKLIADVYYGHKDCKAYALRDGCNLVTVRNGYTSHVAEIKALPKLSILHAG